MSGAPPWRRLAPNGFNARLAAAGAALVGAALLALFVALPLIERIEAAQERAARLDLRAAALLTMAAERSAEAGFERSDAARIDAASTWLDTNARLSDGTAMLELLSGVRLLAEATGVELGSAAPLDADRADAALFTAADLAGLRVTAVEARVTADHAGLARFLAAVEAAEPAMRAAAIEITARSDAVLDEKNRLTASVVIGALSRPEDG